MDEQTLAAMQADYNAQSVEDTDLQVLADKYNITIHEVWNLIDL